jgi:uncharacterized membrane protein YesL
LISDMESRPRNRRQSIFAVVKRAIGETPGLFFAPATAAIAASDRWGRRANSAAWDIVSLMMPIAATSLAIAVVVYLEVTVSFFRLLTIALITVSVILTVSVLIYRFFAPAKKKVQ